MNTTQKLFIIFAIIVTSLNARAQIIPKAVSKEPVGGARDLLKLAKEILPFSSGLAQVNIYQNDGWKYSYIDKNGKEVVLRNLIAGGRFQDGLAKVTIPQNNGSREVLINTTGKQISATYNYVLPFTEGLAAVSIQDKWGFIDKSGVEVIPLKYDNAYSFSNGLAAVYSEKEKGWGFIDNKGNEIIPFRFHYPGNFSEGLAAVSTVDKQELQRYEAEGKKGLYPASPYKWCYIDVRGNKKIELESDMAGPFSCGLAPVGKPRSNEWGYIDTTGKFIIPQIYFFASCFFEGRALVKRGGRWGYIDSTGKEVVPPKYDDALHFSEGLASVCLNGKCGYINYKGVEVIPLKFESYVYPRIMMGNTPLKKTNKYTYSFSDGLAVVRLNGRWVIIDKTGKVTSK